jgi:hypothetical protein
MAEIDVSEKVLEQIRVYGPLKAKKIADALGIDRAEVNRILHGPLRGKVKQANNYTWSLAERIGQGPDKPARNSRENLFAYYLDCVAQDDDSGDVLFRFDDQESGTLRTDVLSIFRGNPAIGDHDTEIFDRRKTACGYLAKFRRIEKQDSFHARLHDRLF